MNVEVEEVLTKASSFYVMKSTMPTVAGGAPNYWRLLR